MSILIDKNTKVITQGITGKTGQFHTRGCVAYANGKNCFVAGVNPKKAGEDFEGIPIYASVKDAKAATGSTVLATPVSAAITCCVRKAIRAASSVGSDSASSRPLQCSDWVPPSTAAIACSATRTMLLSGCWAVSVLPAV